MNTTAPPMTGMTSGMAIALNITVAGIGTALFLKLTYYLLDEAIADLFREITKVTEVYVIPMLVPSAVRSDVSGS